ncbi:PNS1 [Acrasis kona]|uniref:PNS1 n=1 Tax=Acrasis kona TaxID=1008807 RepID=A0AAW2ZCR7_9EUKA
MSEQPQEQLKQEEQEDIVAVHQPDVAPTDQEQIMDIHHESLSDLFKGFFVALSHGVIDTDQAQRDVLADLQQKIVDYGGTFHNEVTDKVNIIIVPSSNIVDTNRILQAMSSQIPIVTDMYIHQSIQLGERLDWSQFLLHLSPSGIRTDMVGHSDENIMSQSHQMDHAAALELSKRISSNTESLTNTLITNTSAPHFALKMFLKGSRQTSFSELFPEVLYTLTWKHKYDIRIACTEKIFEKKNQSKLMESIEMSLVLVSNDKSEVPSYDDEDSQKKKRKRPKTEAEGGSPIQTTPNKQRRQKKPSNTETIQISSLSKSSDDEIIIRFGINSTFCSKRFAYGAFKLFISYKPDDLTDDYHFQIYSAEFKTFVKKNANIQKYLHTPRPLDPTVMFITKANTTTQRIEYAKYMASYEEGGMSPGGTPRGNANKKRKSTGKTGKRKRGEEDAQEEVENNMYVQNHMMHQNPMMYAPDQAGMFYPMMAINYPQTAGMDMTKPPATGTFWMGNSFASNLQNDKFYLSFCKDGVIYSINDFIYLSPDEANIEMGSYAQPNQSHDEHSHVGVTDVVTNNLMHHDDHHHQSSVQSVSTNAQSSESAHDEEHHHHEEEHHGQEDAQQQQQQQDQQAQQQQQDQQQGAFNMNEQDDVTQQSQNNAVLHDEQIPVSSSEASSSSSVVPLQGDDENLDAEMDDAHLMASNAKTDRYWICKIIHLVQTAAKGMMLIGQWYYQSQDVQSFGCNVDNSAKQQRTKKQYILHKDKEVYVSFDINYSTLASVRGKCQVRHMDQEQQRSTKHKKWLSHKDHYFFQSGFNRVKGEVFDLQEPMLKVIRESSHYGDDVGEMDANQLALTQQYAAQYGQPMMAHMGMQAMPNTIGAMNPDAAAWGYAQQVNNEIVQEGMDAHQHQPLLQQEDHQHDQ